MFQVFEYLSSNFSAYFHARVGVCSDSIAANGKAASPFDC